MTWEGGFGGGVGWWLGELFGWLIGGGRWQVGDGR